MKESVKPGILYFIVISMLIFSACSRDEITIEELLAGKWNTGNITLNSTIGGMTLSEYLISTGRSSAEAILYSALLNSTIQSYFSGTLQVNSDKTFAWTMTGSSISSTGTWSLSTDGKELTFNSQEAMSGILKIVELSKTNLNVHLVQTLDQSLTGGLLPALTVEVDLTFTR